MKMKIFSKAQIKQIEQNGFNQGIPSLRMMENAGAAVAKCIRENYPESKYPHAVVLCGKGNNGGDGFVIARKLNESGYKVAVVLTHGRPTGEESAEMLMRLRDLPINVLSMDTDTERCAKIRDAHMGKSLSIEHRAKIAATSRGNNPFKNLLNEIESRKLSYKALSKLIDIPLSFLSYKMQCVRNFTERDKVKLEKFFGKSSDYLLECNF